MFGFKKESKETEKQDLSVDELVKQKMKEEMIAEMKKALPPEKHAQAERLIEHQLSIEREDSIPIAFGLISGELVVDPDHTIKQVLLAMNSLIVAAGPEAAYALLMAICGGIALSANRLARSKKDEMEPEHYEKFNTMTPSEVAREMAEQLDRSNPEWEKLKESFFQMSEVSELENLFNLPEADRGE